MVIGEDPLLAGAAVDAFCHEVLQAHLVDVGSELVVGHIHQEPVLVLRQHVEQANADCLPGFHEFAESLALVIDHIDLVAEPLGRPRTGTKVELLPADHQQVLVVQPEQPQRLDIHGLEAARRLRQVAGLPHRYLRGRIDVRQGQGGELPSVRGDIDTVDHRVVNPGAYGNAFGRKGSAGDAAHEQVSQGYCRREIHLGVLQLDLLIADRD